MEPNTEKPAPLGKELILHLEEHEFEELVEYNKSFLAKNSSKISKLTKEMTSMRFKKKLKKLLVHSPLAALVDGLVSSLESGLEKVDQLEQKAALAAKNYLDRE